MNKLIAATMLFLAAVCTVAAQDPGWPRVITKPQGTLVYYQPQVDNWSNHTIAQGTTGSVQTSSGGKAVGASGAYGNSASAGKAANGNMYASADGNVYKNTGSGWQKAGSNGSWNSVNSSEQHPSSSSSSYQEHPSSSSASSYHPS